jgi:hypothetical protein
MADLHTEPEKEAAPPEPLERFRFALPPRANGSKWEARGEHECKILWNRAGNAQELAKGHTTTDGTWAQAGARASFEGDDAAWDELLASRKMKLLEAYVASEAGVAAAAHAHEACAAAAQEERTARRAEAASHAEKEGWPGGARRRATLRTCRTRS